MSEVIHQAEQDFWHVPPPTTASEVVLPEPALMAEACPRCGTEFLLGSRFCHTCGARRREAISDTARIDASAMALVWKDVVAWTQSTAARFSFGGIRAKIKLSSWLNPNWVSYLRLKELKTWLGLPAASLIAFLVGLGCVLGALLVGLLTAKTLLDWQAIQFYRVEWLLAATASFAAGILLKKPSGD